MWLNPTHVTLGFTCVNHVQCYGKNAREQINIFLYLWILRKTLANSLLIFQVLSEYSNLRST